MQKNLKITARDATRSPCRIDSKISYLNQVTDARVLNVSSSGIALEFQGRFNAGAGSNIRIENSDLGLIEGTVRWCRNGRIGVQIKQSTNSLAQISSYFRHFHKESRPALNR